MTPLPIVGSWRDPLTQQEPVPGRVEQQDPESGLRLVLDHIGFDVYKPLTPSADSLPRPELHTRSWSLLTGLSRGGRQISLLGCALLETRGALGDRPTNQLIAVEHVIEGIELNEKDQAVFVGMIVQVEGLTAWVHSTLLSDDLEKERAWPEMNVVLANGATVELRRHASAEFVSTPRHVGRLESNVADFLIEFPEAVAVDQALDLAEQLSQLVSVAALRRCRPLAVALIAEDDSTSLVHTSLIGALHPDRTPPPPGQYFLPAEAMGDLVLAWTNAWRKKNITPLREAAYAAVEVFDRADLSSGLRLNRAVSAAGSLYRHLEHVLPIAPPHDPQEHKRIREAALAALAPGDAEYLKRRLRDNDRSMTMQLDEIVKQVPNDVLYHLGLIDTAWTKAATSGRSRSAHNPLDEDQNLDAVLARLAAIVVLFVTSDQLGVARTDESLLQITSLRRSAALIRARLGQTWPAPPPLGQKSDTSSSS